MDISNIEMQLPSDVSVSPSNVMSISTSPELGLTRMPSKTSFGVSSGAKILNLGNASLRSAPNSPVASVRCISPTEVSMSQDYNMFGMDVVDVDGRIAVNNENIKKATKRLPAASKAMERSAEFWSQRALVRGASWYHLICFAASLILSASCFSWNAGLQIAGFPVYSICVILNAIAFQILAMCLAELCSGRPFNGGSYGFVRATMSVPAGMFIGLVEIFEYILTSAVNAIQTTTILQLICNTDPKYNIVWDIAILIIATIIQIVGGKFYWNCMLISGSLTVLVLVLYGLGALQFLGSYESNPEIGFTFGTANAFMQALPNSIWFFVGIEALPLCCEETHDAEENVPFGIVWGMAVVVSLSLLVFFTAVGAPHPDLFGASYPLTAGYAAIWNLDLSDQNYRILLIFALIACFSATYSFIFAYGRQMLAMSRSGLLPEMLSITTNYSGTPLGALCSGSAISILVMVSIRASSNQTQVSNYILNMMLLCAVINYLFQLASFAIVRIKYDILKHSYRSPAGLPGAAVSFTIFFIGLIALLFWTDGIGYSILGVFVFVGTGMLYYFFVSSNSIILSPEESYATFMIYARSFSQHQLQKIRHSSVSKKGFSVNI